MPPERFATYVRFWTPRYRALVRDRLNGRIMEIQTYLSRQRPFNGRVSFPRAQEEMWNAAEKARLIAEAPPYAPPRTSGVGFGGSSFGAAITPGVYGPDGVYFYRYLPTNEVEFANTARPSWWTPVSRGTEASKAIRAKLVGLPQLSKTEINAYALSNRGAFDKKYKRRASGAAPPPSAALAPEPSRTSALQTVLSIVTSSAKTFTRASASPGSAPASAPEEEAMVMVEERDPSSSGPSWSLIARGGVAALVGLWLIITINRK